MKRNGYLLAVQACLALITMAGLGVSDWSTGLFYWVLSFCVWFTLLAPAWQHKPDEGMTEERKREKWGQ